jgi:hypothetical protein
MYPYFLQIHFFHFAPSLKDFPPLLNHGACGRVSPVFFESYQVCAFISMRHFAYNQVFVQARAALKREGEYGFHARSIQ